MAGLIAQVDRWQQRHRGLGFPLAVVYKFVDDQGGYLAALITYYAFVSLFPLLLILTTVLSVILKAQPHLQQRILESAVSQFPVIGDQLGHPERLSGGTVGVTVGIGAAVFGGLGVSVAVQNAMNVAWAVPVNRRPDPITVRVRGLMGLITLGPLMLGLTVVSRIVAAWHIGFGFAWLLSAVSVVFNAGVFTIAFKWATVRPLRWRQVAPGAVAAALAWQLLQQFGSLYVGRVVSHASNTNGVFAVVLGLLGFLYLASFAVVLCAEINVVRVDRLYPRALLTPFTENVNLTTGDRRTYTDQAQAQRNKDFEDITVTFDQAPER
ncbi:YihY/virulence factor BrkB family protein [Nocardia sp. CDC159]|uniref:YihY/virulence factor BrkB family protein n=1 Tax=Nocardia pulmonis TaxID=2951408 RepID=A0A9X2EI04_9NOCA|nr:MULTISPECIES: YihY/virulence factor BrkB family protein [Nocardia]MCM6779013.1 YihY/virulence factor BrkB family protein [Nocardia pulmonis]MCM6791891.1 YihY/virulence factor BrkB family protein [Nocardia sp. CDC159]